MSRKYELATFIKRNIKEFEYGDLENFLIIAYQKARFYRPVPEILDVFIAFCDVFEESRLHSLFCCTLDYNLHRSEVCDEDFLEAVLFNIGAEFITSDGNHVNDSQVTLLQNWRSHEPISYTDQHRLAARAQSSHLVIV